MGLMALAAIFALCGQTAGSEQLVGWGAGSCWWDCGDLGSAVGGALSYHWPQWMVQVCYAEPDGTVNGRGLDGELWAIEGFRLWRGGRPVRGTSWLVGAGVGFYDLGVEIGGLERSKDTSSDWGIVLLAGVQWKSGWYVLGQYVVGADVAVSAEEKWSAGIDLDGPRIIVGRRF